LRDFEKRLGLIRKFNQEKQTVDKLKRDIDQLIQKRKEDAQLILKLEQIAKEMDRLVQ